VNPQQPVREGPKCACDEKSIRKMRALLRSIIDHLPHEDEGSLNQGTVERKGEEYEELVVTTVEEAASRAIMDLGDNYPQGVIAVSLISGIMRLWGPGFDSHRISVVLSNDPTLTAVERRSIRTRLAKLRHSPVHAIYRQPRRLTPLWTCFEKPKEAWFRSETEDFNQFYDVECPEAASSSSSRVSSFTAQLYGSSSRRAKIGLNLFRAVHLKCSCVYKDPNECRQSSH
jgi:hypothetical protein